MKETLLMYARHTKQTNASVLALLDGLSHDTREEDRKSYYASLSGLARHILEGRLGPGQWEEVKETIAIADQATIDLVQGISEADCLHPIELDWCDGEPPTVPFYSLAHQLFEHGTHHRTASSNWAIVES